MNAWCPQKFREQGELSGGQEWSTRRHRESSGYMGGTRKGFVDELEGNEIIVVDDKTADG